MGAIATNEEIVTFIKLLGNLAVSECNRRATSGQGFVVPSICIAQSAVEIGGGKSGIMTKANALFGIKAGGSWSGKVYTPDTGEIKSGEAYNTVTNFRAYDSLDDSVSDYYNFIVNNPRYSGAVSNFDNILPRLTPGTTISAIHAGGYSTDDLYVEHIMNIVNTHNLGQWDARINPDLTNTPLNYDQIEPTTPEREFPFVFVKI